MIITQTPVRLSLLGGNTDFPEYYKQYGGGVLTTTIDKYIYCIVNKRFDDMIYINYSIKEKVEKVDDIKHDLVRESLKLVGIEKGIEITFLSDIPSEGSGLGSSSAVVVGLLNALSQFIGKQLTNAKLAEMACAVEIDKLKKPIGVQDQIITAYGGLRHIRLGETTEVLRVEVSDSTLRDFNDSLMLFHTNISRKAEKILVDVRPDKKILDKNKELANLATLALQGGNIKAVGELLDKYWKLKKKLNNKVTNKEIDKMYTKAKKAGAIGGKIVGAGGGGFLLLMVAQDKREAVVKALAGYKELEFKFDYLGSRVIFNNG